MTVLSLLSQPKYFVVATGVALMVVAFAAWLPNVHLITRTMTSSAMTWGQKTNLLTSLLGSLQTNFTASSRIVTLVTAILSGIQVSLLVYYLNQTVKSQQSLGVSALGMVTSMLGVGCASCGSVVLTSLIGLGSTAAVLGKLPFRGQEFGLIGIVILVYAIYLTMKKINDPQVCGVRGKS